jgi:hypothetical protein
MQFVVTLKMYLAEEWSHNKIRMFERVKYKVLYL